jgi:hypothetical protein
MPSGPRSSEDELLLVEGKVQNDAYSGGLRITADKLYTLAEARGRFARSLRLTMNGGSDAKRLQALLTPFRNGPCPVRLSYRNGDAAGRVAAARQLARAPRRCAAGRAGGLAKAGKRYRDLRVIAPARRSPPERRQETM